MKNELKIVFTTDFTDSSHHAIAYAIKLFSEWKGDITYFLLHGFKPMVPYSDTGSVPVISNQSWEKESKQRLEEEAENLREKAKIDVRAVFHVGSVSEVVQKFEEDENPDLFIMASREKSFIERITFGSNTIQIMSNANTPVLAIPLEAEYKKPDKIMFSADFEPLGINFESFKLFKNLVKMFNTKLQVLRVYESEEQRKENSTLENSTIHKYLENLEHEHFPMINADIFEGIMAFINQHTPDIVVMIPRDKNFIEKIFKSSLTRKMTFEGNVPLLILK